VTRERRVNLEPAFILHAWPWRETSLLLDVLSCQHGRLALVARGARRPRSELRGVLLPMQPLRLSWFGSGDVRTLHAAEWEGGLPQPGGRSLLCGLYLNELLQRLLPRDDPHPELFHGYFKAMTQLAQGQDMVALRGFEWLLLQQLGYGFDLRLDAFGAPVKADVHYVFEWGLGLRPDETGGDCCGAAIESLGSECGLSPALLGQQRRLLRRMLQPLLGPQELATRELLRAWPDL
jgi:DNA repair protein RecO (recombination protein O)